MVDPLAPDKWRQNQWQYWSVCV